MNDLNISFASLVKSNNGLFKSPAQAKFLLSQCDNGVYVGGGAVHGNTFQLHYICDAKGVVRVQKFTNAKGLETLWERKEQGNVTVQDVKEIARLKRDIKKVEKSIAERQAAWQSGQYDGSMLALYHSAMSRDQTDLRDLQSRLAAMS